MMRNDGRRLRRLGTDCGGRHGMGSPSPSVVVRQWLTSEPDELDRTTIPDSWLSGGGSSVMTHSGNELFHLHLRRLTKRSRLLDL